VSHKIQEALTLGGVLPDRLSTLYSGVDVSAASNEAEGENIRMKHGIPSDAFLVGTVANLLPIKGLDIMIDALSAVRTKVPKAHYLIVGGGSEAYLQTLVRRGKDRAVSDAVHFVGFRHPPWPYLATMDLYVQPSRDEALGIAAIEAMALGKAVIAAGVGGLPEVVIEGSTGALVPPGDASALAQAVVALFQKPDLRLAMGRAGRERARERFNLDTTIRRLEEIYLAAVAGSRRG